MSRPDSEIICIDENHSSRHLGRHGPLRQPNPPQLVTEIDLTDDTIANCIRCSKTIQKSDETGLQTEDMFVYKTCGCVSFLLYPSDSFSCTDHYYKISCRDCVLVNMWDLKLCWLGECPTHHESGKQMLLKLYGVQCPICDCDACMVGPCGMYSCVVSHVKHLTVWKRSPDLPFLSTNVSAGVGRATNAIPLPNVPAGRRGRGLGEAVCENRPNKEGTSNTKNKK
jgi:hypothetical protein